MFINKIRTNIYNINTKIYKTFQIIPNQFNIINNYYYKYNTIIHSIKLFSIWKFIKSLIKKKINSLFLRK